MTRDTLLFAIIGILLGFIAGFLLASNITQREAAQRAGAITTQASQSLPPNHPQVPVSDQTAGEGGQQMLASVQTAMKQARENPNDFEAQLRSEEHTSELQSPCNLVCRLLLEKKKKYDT